MMHVTRGLKNEYKDCDSLWHTNDGSAIGHFNNIFNLCEIGPAQGHFPEETKSTLIAKEKDTERVSNSCTKNNLSFSVKHRNRHLGGFVGEKTLETTWIKDKINAWMEAVDSVAKIALHAP